MVAKQPEDLLFARHVTAQAFLGDRAVLVVDSCYLPSSAREDIAQIKQWTDKPVRYLVNTHWHYDHADGNQVFGPEVSWPADSVPVTVERPTLSELSLF